MTCRCLLAALTTLAAFPIAADAAPRARDFTLRLDGGTQARTASAGLDTGVLRAPGRFDLVGLTMDAAPEDLGARVRTRMRGGKWTPWEALEVSDNDDDGKPPRATEPMWVGGAEELQVRTARRPRGLRAFFVDAQGARRTVRPAPTGGAQPFARLPTASISAAGPAAAPAIVPRSQWAGDDCAPRAKPEYGKVDLALIHHTVSANSYSPQESAAMVLGVCRYHRNALKWSDIGYPFLVDQFGRIFEGRAGGVAKPVVGAQAQGFNSTSTGVATLGTFESVPFPYTGLRAIARLLAWKLPISGAPTQGLATVRSAGGAQSRFAAGETVRAYRISGHRDVGRTTCPGGALYAQLPALRSLVGNRVPGGVPRSATALTAAPPSRSSAYPQRPTVSGRLAQGASGVSGGLVRVEFKKSTGRFGSLVRARTDSSGRWSVGVPTAFSRTMRAVYPGDAEHRPSRSRQFRVRVAPRIALRTTTPRVPPTRTVVLRGSLRPVKRARVRVIVQRKSASGRYTRGRSTALRPDGVRFAQRIRLTKPGLYRFRARFDGDGRNTPAQTRLIFARVLNAR